MKVSPEPYEFLIKQVSVDDHCAKCATLQHSVCVGELPDEIQSILSWLVHYFLFGVNCFVSGVIVGHRHKV